MSVVVPDGTNVTTKNLYQRTYLRFIFFKQNMLYRSNLHCKNNIKAASRSNGTAFIYGAKSFRFDSCVGQFGHGSKFQQLANAATFSSKRSCVTGSRWRGDDIPPTRHTLRHLFEKQAKFFSCNINTATLTA